jgi:bisanhydrobacterioruberin hydratase
MAKDKVTLFFLKQRVAVIRAFVYVFYLVGLVGMLVPESFSIFVLLIPTALILSFIVLASYHSVKFDLRTLLVFLIIFLISFTIEAIGIKTGIIFGNYQYDYSLGIEIFETPLIIGLNWLILVYISSSVFEKIKIHVISKILLASSLMLVYDIVLEKVAPKLYMWHFEGYNVPIHNYLAWFVISIMLHSFIKIVGISTQNKLAFTILVAQFLFFLVLAAFLK